MTLCETITKLIIRMVEEKGKNLDQIAEELCPSVEYGREKIIRIIKDFLGEEYLIKHAEVLGYDIGKADLARKRKHRAHENIDATTDTVLESNSVTPIASCQTTVPVNQVKDAGQTEQVLVVSDAPAACCQKRAVRRVRKTDSENITEGESEETKEPEKVLEEQDDAPVIDVSDELVGEIKRLIGLYSLEEVKKALEVVGNE